MNNNFIVEVKKIYKNFDGKEALKGIEFYVKRGEIYVLLGPNGAGKTTTVKIIVGVLEPDKGEVFVFGEKMSAANINVKQRISYLPDEPYIYNKLTGKEFLEFMLSIYKKPLDFEKYKFFLSEFGLEEYIEAPIDIYSKGVKQKLLLMSIFLREPELYVLDEPMIGLDPKAIHFFKQYILQLSKENKTVILCTHLLDLAEQLAQKIAIIYNGKILISGDKDEIARQFNLSTSKLEEIYLKLTKK